MRLGDSRSQADAESFSRGVVPPMSKGPRRRPDRRKTAPPPERPKPAPTPDLTVLPIAATKPWYHAGIQFGCTRCGACCRKKGYVCLSNPDIIRMANHLGLSVEEFRSRYTQETIVEGQDRPGVCLVKAPHG